MMQCKICGEFFNPTCLSEVFEHEHKGIQTDKEYFGKKIKINYLTQKQKYQITYMTKEGSVTKLFEGNGNELNLEILDSRKKGIGIIEIRKI